MTGIRKVRLRTNLPTEAEIRFHASQAFGGIRGPFHENGEPVIIGITTPTQDQIAEAEGWRPTCTTTRQHHTKENATMAKDKSKKKQKQVADSADEAMRAAAGPVGLTLVIESLTDDQVATLVAALSDEAPAPASSKAEGTTIEATAVEEGEPEEVVTYTQKQLDKIAGKPDGRAQLVDICHSLGLSEGDTKGKRVGTLASLVLAKQEELAAETSAEFEEGGDDDEWNEDVPPEEDAPKKAKKKKKAKK